MAISPDGQYLAYAVTLGLEQSLWIRGLSGTDAIQLLAPDTVNFSGISFSPDGTFLYFIRSEKTNPVFSYMCRMPVLGGRVDELIRDADSPASFSPDWSHFVYTRGYPPRNMTQVRIADGDGGHDRALIELDGHQVFEAGATWSPDGKRIAVPIHLVGEQSKFILYVVALGDGKAQNLFSSEGDIGRPLWISDGKLLVTLRDGYARGGQLWTISYPDGASERFTNDLTDYSSAIDFSRNQKRLAVIANSLASDVWVAASNDLSHPNQITSGVPPALSVRELVDGRVAMLTSGIEPPPFRARELPTGRTTSEKTAVWTMNADGTHRSSWRGIENPEWIEPCGKALLVLANKGGYAVLLRYENESVPPQALASGDVWAPTCSWDGRFTYYLNFAHPEKIRRISSEDGSTTVIADVLGDTVFGALMISPDGKLLAYPYQQYSPPRVAIAVIPATGGPPAKEFTLPGFSEMLRWSPDGHSLHYLLTNDGVTNLWEQPLNGEKARQVTHFNAGRIFDFTWTRDAKHLLMARGASTTDVVVIDDPR
jgi:Tol biopolymer transport system component